MDININTLEIIGGTEQVEQSCKLLLRNAIGTWAQSYSTGSYVSPHMASVSMKEDVRKTLEKLDFVKVLSVEVSGETVNVEIEYQGDAIQLSVDL